MKAIVYEKYGPPDVLQLKEVEKPAPKDNEVLIKVHAASANPADWHLMRGEPFLARLEAGLLKPKYKILGCDIAGQVEAVGRNVTQFQPGDEVFGEVFGDISVNGLGGFAECVLLKLSGILKKDTPEEKSLSPCTERYKRQPPVRISISLYPANGLLG